MPDYEEAIAQSMKQQPPPSYQVAMSSNGTTTLETNVVANTVALPPEVPLSPPPYNVTDNETITDNHNEIPNTVIVESVVPATPAPGTASGSNAASTSTHNN